LDAVDGDAFNERRAGDVNLGLEGAGINESDRAEGRYQLELNGDGKSERLGKEGREGGRVREGSKRDDDAVGRRPGSQARREFRRRVSSNESRKQIWHQLQLTT
jgi:hypothetical protein